MQEDVFDVIGNPQQLLIDRSIVERLAMAVGNLVVGGKPAVTDSVLGEHGLLIELRRRLVIGIAAVVGAHPPGIGSNVLTMLRSGLGFGSCEAVREAWNSGGELKMVVAAVQTVTDGVSVEETLGEIGLSILSPVDPTHAGVVTSIELFLRFSGGIGTRSAVNVTRERDCVGIGHPINHTLAGGDGSLTEISAHIVLIVKGAR
mmetsp:Transcript_7162/g.10607  ORF Transcript_7162/g.10607 Transcript_7162/m.10607 type:complete len:203 (-) Transcript_7162:479-1087(-)